jgi:O-antigen ligase
MRRGSGAVVLVAPILLLLPVIEISGPGNTAPVDGLIVLFLAGYGAWLLSRHTRLALPLLGSMWLIALGSVTGIWGAPRYYRLFAVVTTIRGVYLYVWFLACADFFARTRRLGATIAVWAAIAGVLGVASFADLHAHVAGGRLLEGAARARGTFENPNMFGSYLVVTFFLTWAAAAAGRRWLFWALPPLVLGVLATRSNGAMLSLLIGTATTILVRPSPHRRRQIGLALAAGALAVAAIAPWYQQVADAAADTFGRERGEVGGAVLKGYEERTALWREAARAYVAHPAGMGPGNFMYLSGEESGTYNSSHNDYIAMLIERGPIGLVGWCVLLVAMGGFVRALRHAGPGTALAWAPLAGLVASVASHAVVVELFHFRHVWLAFALVVAATRMAAGSAAPVIGLGRVRPETMEVAA